MTTAEHAINNIALRRLKIARVGDLNDPFELLAAEMEREDFRRAVMRWKSEFHNTKGLLCFSESWGNPVLWSHYADKHRGICLGFDIPSEYIIPVSYSKDRVPVRFKNSDPDQGLDPDFVNQLLCTKYEHWVYEQEHRMFMSLDEDAKEGGLYFYSFDGNLVLKEVIVGHHCEIPIERIEDLVTQIDRPIEITKARLGFTQFEIVRDQRYERKKKQG